MLGERQSFSSRIWTRVTVSTSYDDNHYTTGTSRKSVIGDESCKPNINLLSGSRWSVVANVLDCDIRVSEFELQSRWYVHFRSNHHHHHVMPPARISLTISRHFSQSFIASGRSSGLHPVSSHSCCMYVRAGRPAFAWPYVGVHRSTSLTSSSLLLRQCPACLARLTCIVFVMGGKWPYSWRLVGCCRQDFWKKYKSYNPTYSYGLKITITVLLKRCLWY